LPTNTRMLSRVIALSVIIAPTLAFGATLKASVNSIELGQQVVLSWESFGAPALISGVGQVTGAGSVIVRPEYSRDFILIAEEAGNVQWSSVHVQVRGTRGEDAGFPEVSEYREIQIHETSDAASFLVFISHVDQVLERNGFLVDDVGRPDRSSWFVRTKFRTQPELLRSSDHGITLRQVSYGILISQDRPQHITYDLSALVRYQRLAEARFREEKEADVIQLAVRKALKWIQEKP
jgi:hypothetical protein